MISSRSKLHELMEKTINSNLQSMEERGEYAEYAVKTNIIESNCALGDMPLSFSDYRIELKPTEDKFLYVMWKGSIDRTPFHLPNKGSIHRTLF